MGWGDELMVAGRARVLQQSDPRKVLVTYQGVPKWSRWSGVWENNPRIARPGESGNFQLLAARDMANNRPYHTLKTAERWSYNPAFRADAGEIYFKPGEVEFAAAHRPTVVVEPNVKRGASPNKDWGWARWQAFAGLARARGLDLVQLGPAGTRVLEGASLIETADFRHGCAVLANAQAYVGHEGGLHHAAAALGIPGVVIFGGFTPVELTGYALHRNLGVRFEEACGLRLPCRHCAVEMAKIRPEQVLEALEVALEERRRRVAA